MAESKPQFESRLKREGRWEEYVRVREDLKKKQLELPESNRMSAQEVVKMMRAAPEWGPADSNGNTPGLPPNLAPESIVAGNRPKPPPPSKRAVKPNDMDSAIFEAIRSSKTHHSMQTSVDWVASVLEDGGYPVGAVETLEAAPTMSAYSLLVWAQASPVNKTEFMKSFFAKLMPTKQEIDSGNDFRDDGRAAMDRLDALENALLAQNEQGSGSVG